MIDLSVLLRRISDLAALIAGKPDLHGAVVTGTSPLEIQLDAAPDPLQGSPGTLVSGLQIGDRVLVAMQNHRARVIGRMTGYPAATETSRGIAEIATQAEVDAGTDAERYVTPATLRRICKVSAKTSGNQTATTTEVTISGVSADFTLAATTQVRVSLQFNGYSSAAGDVIVLRVKDGGTTVAVWTVPANSSGAATSLTHSLSRVVELTSGSHTLTATFVRVAGSGTITSNPTTLSPAELRAEAIVLT